MKLDPNVIAEAIWQAESVRGGGKKRSVEWDDIGDRNKVTYLFIAYAVIDAISPTRGMSPEEFAKVMYEQARHGSLMGDAKE